MNRTLLVEEGDDEVANRQDKKKREKEKFVESAGTLQDSVYCLTKRSSVSCYSLCLTIYTLTSVCTFSLLSSVHFLRS